MAFDVDPPKSNGDNLGARRDDAVGDIGFIFEFSRPQEKTIVKYFSTDREGNVFDNFLCRLHMFF